LIGSGSGADDPSALSSPHQVSINRRQIEIDGDMLPYRDVLVPSFDATNSRFGLVVTRCLDQRYFTSDPVSAWMVGRVNHLGTEPASHPGPD